MERGRKDRGKPENKNKLGEMNDTPEKKTFSFQSHLPPQTDRTILCSSERSKGVSMQLVIKTKRIEFLFFTEGHNLKFQSAGEHTGSKRKGVMRPVVWREGLVQHNPCSLLRNLNRCLPLHEIWGKVCIACWEVTCRDTEAAMTEIVFKGSGCGKETIGKEVVGKLSAMSGQLI